MIWRVYSAEKKRQLFVVKTVILITMFTRPFYSVKVQSVTVFVLFVLMQARTRLRRQSIDFLIASYDNNRIRVRVRVMVNQIKYGFLYIERIYNVSNALKCAKMRSSALRVRVADVQSILACACLLALPMHLHH